MGNNNKRLKQSRTRERVFKAIAIETEQDLFTLREKLVRKLHVVDSGNKFDAAIEELKQQGRLIQTGKKIQINPEYVKEGVYFLSGTKSYIVFDGSTRQVAIDRKFAGDAHNGERVRVCYTMQDDRPLPFIVPAPKSYERHAPEVLQPKHSDVIPEQTDNPNLIYGRVIKTDHDNLVFIPNDKARFKTNIMILNDHKTWAKYQDKICTMELVPQGTSDTPMGFIREIKGEAGNPIAEYDAIAESHGANMGWSDEAVRAEIAKIPTEVDLSKFDLMNEQGQVIVNNGASEKIVDLRHLPFTTTDPATCKDMDDAIYSTFDEKGNLVVYTAVADVSRYVDLDSEIGRRYIKGGFTTYAPNKAYNILPPELSTGICSLNPQVDRLALVIKTVVNPRTGNPISSSFMEAVIESKEKFSYEQAQEITDAHPEITRATLQEKAVAGKPLTREELVVQNKVASDILWKGFNARNQIQFNTNSEYDVVFNADYSDILDLKPQEHCEYHKVIEAFMVTANEATAEFAMKHVLPNIYRVHDAPNEDRLEQAYEFFGYLNIPFDGDLSPTGTKALIKMVEGTNREKVVNNFLVRLQSKAKYSISTNPKEVELVKEKSRGYKSHTKQLNKNRSVRNNQLKAMIDGMRDEQISHFGLQSLHYSHTTSPIRRITDYVTHKNILAYINGGQILDLGKVRDVALWANMMQDQNDLAEREFNELNSAIYCENHINEVMKGRVCGFKTLETGKSVRLENLMILVENEEKGVRVQIPAIEILGSKAASKNIGISAFGSAIINKVTNQALITLCDEVEFKIAEADRLTRTTIASTNLLRDYTKVSALEEMHTIQGQVQSVVTREHTPNARTHSDIYERDQEERRRADARDVEEAEENKRAGKELRQANARAQREGYAEELSPEEARQARKSANANVKSNRGGYNSRYKNLPYVFGEDDYDLDEEDYELEDETKEEETTETTQEDTIVANIVDTGMDDD